MYKGKEYSLSLIEDAVLIFIAIGGLMVCF